MASEVITMPIFGKDFFLRDFYFSSGSTVASVNGENSFIAKVFTPIGGIGGVLTVSCRAFFERFGTVCLTEKIQGDIFILGEERSQTRMRVTKADFRNVVRVRDLFPPRNFLGLIAG